MVSDEQRREIAANLRSESEAWLDTFPDSTLNDEDNDAIMFDISRFVLFEGTPTVGEFYAHLADLIERPTCENGGRLNERTFLCSACGYEAYAYSDSDCNPNDFSYCPDCGAEVIE